MVDYSGGIYLLVFVIAFLFLACFYTYGKIILSYRKEKLKHINKLDKFTTKFYTNELDKIIEYRTVFYIDSTFGKSFSFNKTISDDIDNEQLSNALNEAIVDINNCISKKMREYLVDLYGELWLTFYIRTQTLSILLNYTKYTLNSLTIEKFN